MKPIDIFITTFLRQEFTAECILYLTERTKSPYRLFIIDNGGNKWLDGHPAVYRYIPLYKSVGNAGIHWAWNTALALAESEYFITSDPDLLVPDLFDYGPDFGKTPGDWLKKMIAFMDERPDYGAISMMPHIFIGAAGIDPKDPEDVKDRNMCGAVFRIMRTDLIRSIGGWDLRIEAGRNHEERTICSKIHAAGYKTGITSRIRAYHNFGKNWGYPEEFTPEMQKHNPALKEEVLRFDNRDAYNPKTWLPK